MGREPLVQRNKIIFDSSDAPVQALNSTVCHVVRRDFEASMASQTLDLAVSPICPGKSQ